MTQHEIDLALREQGWVQLPAVFAPDLVAHLNADLQTAYDRCRQIQVSNGVEVNTDGTVHHLPGLGPSFLELLERITFAQTLRTYFHGNFILNSYGGVINMPGRASYVCNVHRDLRTFSGPVSLMLNMLVMLDPFTPENGATHLLAGSHLRPEPPSDEAFYAGAARAVGQPGDVVLWNSNLWHAAGRNSTDHVRRALTLTWTRPFMKQQLDYTRALGYGFVETLSEDLQQMLGYFARVPSTLDEWYQPPKKRMYRPGQG